MIVKGIGWYDGGSEGDWVYIGLIIGIFKGEMDWDNRLSWVDWLYRMYRRSSLVEWSMIVIGLLLGFAIVTMQGIRGSTT